jgi:hypothetical protein
MSSEGLNRHLAHKDAAAPLTEREVEMKSIKLAQVGFHLKYFGRRKNLILIYTQSQVDTSTASRRSHTQGISFGIQDEAEAAIKSVADGSNEALTLVCLLYLVYILPMVTKETL